MEDNSLYAPLQANLPHETNENVTSMAEARVLSKFTFWWLNSLMVKRKNKLLDDKYIPKLQKCSVGLKEWDKPFKHYVCCIQLEN